MQAAEQRYIAGKRAERKNFKFIFNTTKSRLTTQACCKQDDE